MAQCTEICLLSLQPDATIEDTSSEAGKIWADTMKTVASQDGYQQSYWSRQIEEPNMLIWLIDWDSIASHQKFMNSDSYKPFFAHAAPIFDLNNPPLLYHVNFMSHPPQPFKVGPVTELVTFMLPHSISSSDSAKFESLAKNCIEVFSKAEGGPNSVDGGWVVEGELENPSAKGTKAKPFTFALAWDSVEHHTQFRTTEPFEEGIGELRGMVVGRWMGHVKCIPAE